MFLVPRAKRVLPGVVQTRALLPFFSREYLVVTQAKTAYFKIRCIMSVFILCFSKTIQI